MASIFTVIIQVSRFATDAAGLEKSLRLLQGLSQVLAVLTPSPTDAAPWLQARKQFALGRRYLRFFKFIDAFAQAYKWFNSPSGIAAILGVGKWSCLGIYFLLESCTIMDAMEIWNTAWAPALLLEANKFWFYSLLFSIASSFLQLLRLYSSAPSSDRRASDRSTRKAGSLAQSLPKKILTDACDLIIPGFITGWLMTSPVIVGLATMIGTLLASEEIWIRVQTTVTTTNDAKTIARVSEAKRKGKV